MTAVIPDLVALLIAATGWYYLFYSRAANNLEGIEVRQINFKRVLCRRINGGVIVALGAMVFAGLQNLPPVVFVVVWIVAMALLAIIVVLAMVDVRLTWQLAKVRRRRQG